MAIDTTLGSLRRDVLPGREQQTTIERFWLRHAGGKSESIRARLVVLAAEVGSRWSGWPWQKLRPSHFSGRTGSNSGVQFSHTQFSASLLDRRPVPGPNKDAPTVHEVARDARFRQWLAARASLSVGALRTHCFSLSAALSEKQEPGNTRVAL